MVIQWLRFLGDSGQHELIEEFITSLRQRMIAGVTANAHHYAAALRGFHGKDNFERGRKIYEMVTHHPVNGPDKLVLNAMFDLCGADQFTYAKKLFDLAVQHQKVFFVSNF